LPLFSGATAASAVELGDRLTRYGERLTGVPLLGFEPGDAGDGTATLLLQLELLCRRCSVRGHPASMRTAAAGRAALSVASTGNGEGTNPFDDCRGGKLNSPSPWKSVESEGGARMTARMTPVGVRMTGDVVRRRGQRAAAVLDNPRRQIAVAQRRKAAELLRELDWSYQRIADCLGVGRTTIFRDLEPSPVPVGTPVDSIGADGRRYPGHRLGWTSGCSAARQVSGEHPCRRGCLLRA
jgi:hypothetical protein